jgi:hypothetical protein
MSNVMWRRNAVAALLAAVAATATDGALGFIGIFSIGLGLLINAGLSAWPRSGSSRRQRR